jgi:hypothetical protein
MSRARVRYEYRSTFEQYLSLSPELTNWKVAIYKSHISEKLTIIFIQCSVCTFALNSGLEYGGIPPGTLRPKHD